MNIRKITAAVMAVTILAGMTACGNTAEESVSESTTAEVTTTVAETTTATEETTTTAEETVAETTAVTEETTTAAETTTVAEETAIEDNSTDFSQEQQELTAISPEDVIAKYFESDGAETIEYYKNRIIESIELNGNLCVFVDDNIMVSIVNSGNMESVDISKNAEYADIKIVEGNGTYYLVTKCVKGFDTTFRTWGEVIDISTAEAVADYYYEYDEASCTDSTPVDELPTSEEFDSYADLTVVENISQTLKDIFNN